MKYKILKSEFNDFQDYLKDIIITKITTNSIFTSDNNEYIFEDINQFKDIKNIYEINSNLPKSITNENQDKYDELIYGKDPLDRIVNISFDDNLVYIYRELKDGTIDTKVQQANYWIIGSNRPTGKYITLEGNQNYKYLKEYTDFQTYNVARTNAFKYKHDCYSISNIVESYMVRYGLTYFKGMKLNEVSVLSFDIETTTLNPKDSDAQVLLISNTYRNCKGEIKRRLFCVDDYGSDTDMILDWVEWVRKQNPSILVGHNLYGFDLPYLYYRSGNNLRLGRDDSNITFAQKNSNFRVDGSQSYSYFKVSIKGVEIIDTYFLSIKYDINRKYNNYKLKNIVEQEGLTDPNRQLYDADKIRENWFIPEERKKIKNYCIGDSDDALKLFDLMIPSFFYFTQHVPKPFQLINESASGSQINSMMVRSYLQYNHSLPKSSDKVPFEGAISFSIPGLYYNVFKVDVNSLYPSIMLQYSIYSKDKDPKCNMLYMLNYFTKERLKNKQLGKTDKYYKDLEQSQKIFLNSTYGYMGSQGLVFNFPKGAAEVCKKGREILNIISNWASNKEINYWHSKVKNNQEGEDEES